MLSKHLIKYKNNLPVKSKIECIDSICAFTGAVIHEGVRLKNIVSDVFTDWEYVKHQSDHVSVDIAVQIAEVIPSERSGFNSLRNYSFYADENEFRLLKRDHILDLLLNVPSLPFVIGVTYSNKKHLSFKCRDQYDTESFVITTDTGPVLFDLEIVNQILPIMRSWYTVVKGKEDTAARPTYFSKDDMLNGGAMYNKQVVYGLDRYEKEDNVLKLHRGTQLMKLLLFTLNKSI